MNENIENRYYLYRHIRLDNNVPFYVGIGTKNFNKELDTFKKEYSRAFKDTERSIYWHNINNKTDHRVEIVFETNDYDFIKQKEIEFVKLYGRSNLGLGPLCNLTDGGEGCTGWKMSEITKEKIRKATMSRVGVLSYRFGKPLSEEHKKSIGDANRNKKRPPRSIETRKKMSISLKGTKSEGDSVFAKKVLDTATNIIYPSAKTVARLFNLKYGTFKGYLSNSRTNKTSFIYLTDKK